MSEVEDGRQKREGKGRGEDKLKVGGKEGYMEEGKVEERQ